MPNQMNPMDMNMDSMEQERQQVLEIIKIAADAGVEITPEEALAYVRGEPNIDLEMLINNSNMTKLYQNLP